MAKVRDALRLEFEEEKAARISYELDIIKKEIDKQITLWFSKGYCEEAIAQALMEQSTLVGLESCSKENICKAFKNARDVISDKLVLCDKYSSKLDDLYQKLKKEPELDRF